jgi:hypothetical protein
MQRRCHEPNGYGRTEMAEIVFAAGAPHAPGLIGLLEAAPAEVKDIVTAPIAISPARLPRPRQMS